ncbi:adenylyl-sulfate kinase [Streptomyces sp. NBC_00690]|uniref:adenylyl-sulfate kinase n=1 Tax=Streptomyces sp. NBC_00690 TaxID=2975808 RepID=UPI003FA7D9CE
MGAAHAAAGIGYLEVWVGPPLEGCVRRDVKGLHAKANTGQPSGISGMAGWPGRLGWTTRTSRPRHPSCRCVSTAMGSASALGACSASFTGTPRPPVWEGRGGWVRCGSRGCATGDGSPRRRP